MKTKIKYNQVGTAYPTVLATNPQKIMNKSTGLMYSYVDGTYNPIKGICMFLCLYCFMITMRQRFNQDGTLRLDEKELTKPLGKGKFIFVGSSTDEFAHNIPSEWLIRVLNHLYEYPDNTYQLQSKNPRRFLEFVNHPLMNDPKRVIFCTTLESDIDYSGSKAPSMQERVAAMQELSRMGFQTMVTVEPMMAFSSPQNFAELIASCNPMQVNIGVNTSRTVKLQEPTKNEFQALMAELNKRNINVHLKKNIERML